MSKGSSSQHLSEYIERIMSWFMFPEKVIHCRECTKVIK